MIDIDEERFLELAQRALAGIPGELIKHLDNVALFVEEQPPLDSPHLLGLYEGIPLTERDSHYGGVMPDRITVYRQPTLAICATEDDVVREVNITVVHEVAHHFGIDDVRLHELGYG